ncbi:MAG: hypothetical protein ACYC9Z_18270 [Casimicrobiaceae bacterium]
MFFYGSRTSAVRSGAHRQQGKAYELSGKDKDLDAIRTALAAWKQKEFKSGHSWKASVPDNLAYYICEFRAHTTDFASIDWKFLDAATYASRSVLGKGMGPP